jgi:hypothetical protein
VEHGDRIRAGGGGVTSKPAKARNSANNSRLSVLSSTTRTEPWAAMTEILTRKTRRNAFRDRADEDERLNIAELREFRDPLMWRRATSGNPAAPLSRRRVIGATTFDVMLRILPAGRPNPLVLGAAIPAGPPSRQHTVNRSSRSTKRIAEL